MKSKKINLSIFTFYWISVAAIFGLVFLLAFFFSNQVSVFFDERIYHSVTPKHVIVISFFLSLLAIIVAFVPIYYFRKFMQCLKNDFIFTKSNIRTLKLLSITLVTFVIFSLAQEIFIRLNLETINNEPVPSKFSFHLSILLLALFIWILKHVFSKGFYLQKETDLTI